jgi:AcrR family transcriptional regulator
MTRDLKLRGENRNMPRAKRAQNHSPAAPYRSSPKSLASKQSPAPSLPGMQVGRELPGLRERKKARLRQQIVETALRLFHKRGYESTRIEDIVQALDISQPTFFRYFPSKDAVLREVGKKGFACQVEKLKLELSSEAATSERLRRFYETMAKLTEADRPLWQAVVLAGAMDPVRSPDMREPEEASVSLLREILAQGQERGDVTRAFPVVHLAEFMQGLFNTVVRQWAVDLTGPHKLSERVRSAVEFFLRAAEP